MVERLNFMTLMKKLYLMRLDHIMLIPVKVCLQFVLEICCYFLLTVWTKCGHALKTASLMPEDFQCSWI